MPKKDNARKAALAAARSEQTVACEEAAEVLARMTKQLRTLDRFVVEEINAVREGAMTPRRLARLLLVSDDLATASKLSQKRHKP